MSRNVEVVGVRVGTVVSVVVAAVALAVLPTGTASAHAVLLGTSPPANTVVDRAPDEVTLIFNQAVTVGSVTVTDEDGHRVDTGVDPDDHAVRVHLRPDRPDGVYTVAYRVTSTDGHLVSGEYPFAIGHGDLTGFTSGADSHTPGLGLGVVLRWVLFVGLALAAGGLIGGRLTDRYRAEAPGPPPQPWVWQGATLAVLATLGLAAQLVGGGDVVGHPVLSRLTDDAPGRALLVELAGFGLAALGGLRPGRSRWAPVTGALLATAAVAEAARGHPGEDAWWGAPLGAVHLLAAAVWVGALVHVVRAGWAWRSTPAAGWLAALDYARLAAYLVVVVVGTGVLAAVVVLPGPGALVDSGYGRALLVKMVLVVAGVGLALAARRALTREPGPVGVPPSRPARFEAGALVAILGVTALVVSLSPGVSADAPLAFPPAPAGPVVPLGTRVGQVTVGVVASSGQVVIRLHAPEPEPGAVPDYRVSVRLREPGDTEGDLAVRPCGPGCFTGPAVWRDGTSELAVDVRAAPWRAGVATVSVPWPPRPEDSGLLAAVVETLRATPRLVIHETITSDTTVPVPQTELPLSGAEFLRSEPFGSGPLPPVVVLGRDGTETQIGIGYPTEGIYDRLWVGPGGRLTREALTGPNHYTERDFTYG